MSSGFWTGISMMRKNFMNMCVEKPGENITLSESPIHDAQDLTKGGSVAQIVLNKQLYTLRITRLGKLILTK